MKQPDHKNYRSICAFLRDYRKYLQTTNKSKYTQTAVSKYCKLGTAQFLSNIEREKCLPPIDVTIRLFEYYGINKKIAYDLFLKLREREYRQAFLTGSN